MTEEMNEQSWIRLACTRSVVTRALKYAVVVGAILIAVNHGDAILRAELSMTRLLKMILTVFVPYAVSTSSSVAAMRETHGTAGFGSR
ncbi:MAG: nitrate/nitrite transporter NrtS [Thermoanaerobaculia bacterium]